MMINLYNANETDFTHNGILVLSDCKAAFIEEELNGKYELELDYPLDSRGKWQQLTEGNIIKADGQLFRIYNKQKTLTGIKVNARHIFYDLMDNFLEDVRPTDLSGVGALSWVLDGTQYPHNFTATGDVGGNDTRYFIRKNVVEAILGKEGIVDTWGGEIERDNFIIRYKQARGLDRGVLVSYGKNIIGIEETIDLDSVCTRMMPIGFDGVLLPERYIDSPYIGHYPHPKVKVVDFPDCETESELRAAAQAFMDNGNIDVPSANYNINFIELSKTEEYKNYAILESVFMGDTVTIRHSKLGIDLKAKVIRMKKNILTDRIEQVELGSFKPNIATAMVEVKTRQERDRTTLQRAIDNATTQINSALGGYVLKRNGELLIMDTEDVMTATKVWRWNQGGLGYSSTGYNGPYSTAITADGSIVADFITTGNLDASIITTGVLLGIVIKTAENGDRLEISGNVLTSYDTNNIKRYELTPTKFLFYDEEGKLTGTFEGFDSSLSISTVSRLRFYVNEDRVASFSYSPLTGKYRLDLNHNEITKCSSIETDCIKPDEENKISIGDPSLGHSIRADSDSLWLNSGTGGYVTVGAGAAISAENGSTISFIVGGKTIMRIDSDGIHDVWGTGLLTP